jgi:hypothetical protein
MTSAPKSSMMAIVSKNNLSDAGTRLPNNDKIPKAKAMSVAAGIAQPLKATLSPQLKAT